MSHRNHGNHRKVNEHGLYESNSILVAALKIKRKSDSKSIKYIIDMNIKRFATFPGMNEDAILNVCRHPNASPLFVESPFYKDDMPPVFLFVEESDINWIKKPESFSMNIRFIENPLEKKAFLIAQINGMPIAVFIKEDKAYTYYGIYKLVNPYHNVGGLNGGIDHYAPLVFQYVGNE